MRGAHGGERGRPTGVLFPKSSHSRGRTWLPQMKRGEEDTPSLFLLTLNVGEASDASYCRNPFTLNELFIQ